MGITRYNCFSIYRLFLIQLTPILRKSTITSPLEQATKFLRQNIHLPSYFFSFISCLTIDRLLSIHDFSTKNCAYLLWQLGMAKAARIYTCFFRPLTVPQGYLPWRMVNLVIIQKTCNERNKGVLPATDRRPCEC